jgi:hypothetical protein
LETLLAEPHMRQAFARLGGRTLVAWVTGANFRAICFWLRMEADG